MLRYSADLSRLDALRDGVCERFTVTVVEGDDLYRIVGGPVEIKAASDFPTRNGVAVA